MFQDCFKHCCIVFAVITAFISVVFTSLICLCIFRAKRHSREGEQSQGNNFIPDEQEDNQSEQRPEINHTVEEDNIPEFRSHIFTEEPLFVNLKNVADLNSQEDEDNNGMYNNGNMCFSHLENSSREEAENSGNAHRLRKAKNRCTKRDKTLKKLAAEIILQKHSICRESLPFSKLKQLDTQIHIHRKSLFGTYHNKNHNKITHRNLMQKAETV